MYPNVISSTYFTWLSKAILIVLVGILSIKSITVCAQDLVVSVKLKSERNDVGITEIILLDNGKEVTRITQKRKKLKLDLLFGRKYAIRFEKPGYVTKEVLVDTRNVPLHMREEFLDFAFEIELFEETQYPKGNLDSLKMAKWQYNTDYGMFDFERIDDCYASDKQYDSNSQNTDSSN